MNNPSTAENSEPPSSNAGKTTTALLQRFFGKKPSSLRTVIEDYIESAESEDGVADTDPATASEKELISNILQLGVMTAHDVMIPRSEIKAIPHDITHTELIAFVEANPFSRFPVYREDLDDVIGTVHLKDLFVLLAPEHARFNLDSCMRAAEFISPTLPLLTIFQTMRATRHHMMLVVDEYGGVDGIVTMGDVLEAIVGRVDDEHDKEEEPALIQHEDGSAIALARLEIDEFEDAFGDVLDEEQHATIDTLGGLIMDIAGRIPETGEIIHHEESGLSFHILEADQRRIEKVRIVPSNPA